MPLKKLSPIHDEIIRRLLLGERPSVIAQDLGIDQGRLSVLMNQDPLFIEAYKAKKEEVDKNYSDVAIAIRRQAPKAFKVLMDLMLAENEPIPYTVRANIARDILNRAGFVPIQKVQSASYHEHKIVPFEQRLRNMKRTGTSWDSESVDADFHEEREEIQRLESLPSLRGLREKEEKEEL